MGLIEIVIVILVMAIALPVLVQMLGQNADLSSKNEMLTVVQGAGQSLMEEILSRKWDENSPVPPGAYSLPLGPEVGESRPACAGSPASYDDVDDYHGYSEDCQMGGMSFTRRVQVCYVPSGDFDDTTACGTPTDNKRIQLTVTSPVVGSATLVTVVTNY